MEIQGIESLDNKLKRLSKKYGQTNVSVVVGYEAKYAVHVHEDMEQKLRGLPRPSGIGVYWGPNGQPKFLEQPARQHAKDYARIVEEMLKRGATMEQALLAAGTQLQRDSQELVPVEFGNLKASAFTEVEQKNNSDRT